MPNAHKTAPRLVAPQGLQEKIRQFTPNWFAMTMGNGIVFLILMALPVQFSGKRAIAEALWVIDIAIFAGFAVMLTARFVCFPETIRPLLHHPQQSMFFGAIPMGFAPLVNGIVLFMGGRYGASTYHFAFVLWCTDAALSVIVALGVPYLVFTVQSHAFERVSAVLLLPLVAPEVAASSAAVIAQHASAPIAQFMIGAGYVLWAISVPLALMVLTIVFFRLVIHKLPHRDMGPSSWLTLGPIGTGALGLLTLGQAAPAAFATSPLASVALTARDLGVIGALLLWGLGAWWLVTAILFTLRYCREGMPFNLGWWAFTFPLGVYTVATLALGHVTGFGGFEVIGMVLALLFGVLWSVVITSTVRGLIDGRLLFAPCLVAVR
jgi:C4-dicarboxylate transporter/malic acid transport protein